MFFNEKKEIPFSKGKYWLYSFGKILDSENNIIEINNSKGKKTVLLDWFNGLLDYDLDIILGLTLFNIKLPLGLLDQIEIIYTNKDINNQDYNELSYRFKNGKIEVKEIPGFYYIPYYTAYCISINGDIIKIKNHYKTKWSITAYQKNKNIKGGYRVARGFRDIDNIDYISRHKALALTFILYNINPWKLVINHKDGIPGNDFISNLEWVTKAENNQHAYDNGLFCNKLIPILMKNIKTGIIKNYSSIANCMKENNFTEGFIRNRLKKNYIHYDDHICFKIDDNSDWRKLNPNIIKSSKIRDVVCKNILTNDVFIFINAEKAADFIKVNGQTVLNHCQNKYTKTCNGYLVRYLSDISELSISL